MACLSSAGSVRAVRRSPLLVAVSRGCALFGPEASPTRLRNDCDNPGAKLAMAMPATSATMERGRRPIMPWRSAASPDWKRFPPYASVEPGSLKIFRDGLEFVYHRPRRVAPAVCRCVEAVIDVIVNQRLLAPPDGFLNGVELLSQIEARSALLDHGNDAPQMALRAPQPLHDLRVALVNESIHAGIISPRMGSIKPRPRRPLPAECRGGMDRLPTGRS